MKIKYQAVMFGDFSGFSATPERTLSIMQRMAEHQLPFLPGTFFEMAIPNAPLTPRLRFASQDELATVQVGTSRLDVFRQTSNFERPVEIEMEAFVAHANQVISAVLGDGNMVFSRMALVVTSVSTNETEEMLGHAFGSLVSPNQFYTDAPIKDWTVRMNSRRSLEFGNRTEEINAIQKVDRTQGRVATQEGNWQEFDKLFVEVDINTLVERVEPRFSPADANAFLAAGVQKIAEIQRDLTATINVEL